MTIVNFAPENMSAETSKKVNDPKGLTILDIKIESSQRMRNESNQENVPKSIRVKHL